MALNAAENSLVAAFAAAPREPAWLAEARGVALGRFRALGLPTTRDEDWRFTNLAGLGAIELRRAPAEGASSGATGLLAPAAAPGRARLVFVNGRFRADLSSDAGMPRGTILTSLSEALRRAPDEVRPHLGRLAPSDGHAFVAANTALFQDGAFLRIPANAHVDVPVSLVHHTDVSAPAATHPRTLVIAGDGARATIEEVFGGGAGVPYLTNAVTEIVLGAGAAVEHVRVQLEGMAAYHVSVLHAEQGAGSSLSAHAFSLGARLSRAEIRARLVGEGAQVAANGLTMAAGDQVVDHFSWVEHAAPRCTTTETYKGILDGKSRGVFSGRIRVLPGAQKTVAHQMSSNLLLSDDAIVDAKPQLEIFADDVKCGHGGTVGQLDAAALFYLRSRGLAEAEARSLLIWGFASEMVRLVGAPALRARARNVVASRLPAGDRILEAAA
jgi:Fe-S cluster assembly protein SufD